MDREVVIKTFPTIEGDTQVRTRLSVLTEEQVFTQAEMPLRIVVNGKPVDTFDGLLEEIQRTKETEPIEITRFRPVQGG